MKWYAAQALDAHSAQRWSLGFRVYVGLQAASFALYATLGKGFAYAGLNPIYVGECLLLAGLVAALATRRLPALVRRPLGILLLVFAAWQVAQTLPYLDTYRLDTLRDACVWGYSAFAWIMAALVMRLDGMIDDVIRRFSIFATWYIFLGPLCALLTQYYFTGLPAWPGTLVTIPNLKCGDLCVHLAGVAAFLVSGLAARKYWWLIPIACAAMVGGAANRGGLLAFGMSVMVAVTLTLRPERVYAVTLVLVTLIVLLFTFDPEIPMPGRNDRNVSAAQILENITSIVANSEDPGGTKEWRLNWWSKIVGYTVYGEYFWTGKGYGINLAKSDGVPADRFLRSPHNSHLTLLARSGVPGFLLWAFLQVSWLVTIATAFVKARRRDLRMWSSLYCWLIAYWVAFMTDAAFDVALEGPMLAIPFWILVGFGWGSTLVFYKQLEAPRALRYVLYCTATAGQHTQSYGTSVGLA